MLIVLAQKVQLILLFREVLLSYADWIETSGTHAVLRNGSGKTKITNFDLTNSVNKDVGRFDIPVHYVGFMKES